MQAVKKKKKTLWARREKIKIWTHFKCSIPLSSDGGSYLGGFLMTECNLSRLQDPSGVIITPFAFPRLPWEQLISWTNRNTIITASHRPNQNELKSETVIVHWYQLQMLSYLHWAMKLLKHPKNMSRVFLCLLTQLCFLVSVYRSVTADPSSQSMLRFSGDIFKQNNIVKW